MAALDFNHFDLVRILRQHRQMIYYCTRLKQAQPEEREAIQVEMAQRPELQHILHQLVEVDNAGDLVSTERERRDRATHQRRLAEVGEEAAAAASWSQSRKVLDLDDLAFAQGSHLMTNKRCALPEGSERTNKKSYEAITVPSLKPRPFDANEVSFG